MGLLFLGDERHYFVAMIKEIAQGVEYLGLRNSQGLGDVEDGFAMLVKRDYMADCYP